MKELSIFIDESGDFGDYAEYSSYYIISMVLHDYFYYALYWGAFLPKWGAR